MGQNAKVRASALGLFCLLSILACITSCSNAKDGEGAGEPVTEAPASRSDALGASFTVRLRAPSPVSPIAPVIESFNSVFMGPGSNIVSGSLVAMSESAGVLHAEPDALMNETWSRGAVELRDRVKVRGILHTKNPPALDAGFTPGGVDTTPLFDPPSTLSWTATYPNATATTSVEAFINDVKTAAPGQYDRINASSQGTITLSSGTYYVNTFIIESAGLIRLDQSAGPVIIYVANQMFFRGGMVSTSGAPPDVLFVYLSTTAITIDALFDGAFIAPNATLALHQLTGIHTGFFAAKDYSSVEAGVKVQYRAPLAILKAARPTGTICRTLLSGLVPASSLTLMSARYCGDCFDDTDRDGVPDCMDACPYDPAKTTDPGVCGCGRPETDTDLDGTPDCVDKCPNDPNNTSMGQCGCVGLPGLKPAGTPCNDRACNQGGLTCNGAGVCGTRSVCVPGNNCKFIESEAVFYYICGERFPTGAPLASDGGTLPPPSGQLSQTLAQSACSAKGMTLGRVDTLSQDKFIARFLTTPAWLGANDLTTNGTWRWAAPGTLNGDQFWSGGPTGAPVGNLFTAWGSGSPGTQQRCAMMRRDGLWFDADCSEPAGYVCEYRLPSSRAADAGLGPGIGPSGMPGQPPLRGDGSAGAQSKCITEPEAGLTTDAAVLQQQIALTGQDVFVGAAASPPAVGSKCPDDPDANGIGVRGADAGDGCTFTVAKNAQGVPIECLQPSDCAPLGAAFVCRQVKNDPNCSPNDGGLDASRVPTDAGVCRGKSLCGTLFCPPDPFPNRCNQLEICGPIPDTVATGPDPGSNLDAEAFNPAQLFDAGIPPALASTSYSDDPIRGDAGKNHSWCFMKPQNANAIADATQAAKNKKGTSGASSVITFGFDPDLVFDVKTPQLALGAPDLSLHAAGRFVAKVSLNNFLGQSYAANIIDVAAGVQAKLCEANDSETHFQVLGLDFVDPGDLPLFDTKVAGGIITPQIANLSKSCSNAVDDFTVWANRAKKAFRDAQQLVGQYKSLGGLLSGDLCEKIGVIGADVPGFPGGNICYPNEPVEITINRFLDYFQAPGSGQIAQLRSASKKVSDAIQSVTDALSGKVNENFINFNREESHTIVNVPFAIGPVPMLLQIDAFAEYGISGGFALDYNFAQIFGLDTEPSTDPAALPDSVASLKARVVPHASAGLSAFVAAGVSLGPLSAAVGLEGAVSLAEVEAPIYAGVGVGLIITKDIRPLPQDIAPLVAGPEAAHFRIPKAFKFFVTYDYGAAVELAKVMSGEINAKLRIKFAFFSRTWRKRVVKFSGWSFHFDLIKGGNALDFHSGPPRPVTDSDQVPTNVVSGATTMGLSENQVPLMKLPYLALPDNPPPPDAGVAFDASAVQGFFYDDLCCSKKNEKCNMTKTPRCCPGFTCFATEGDNGEGFCSPHCRVLDETCSSTSDCCTVDAGPPLACGAMGLCTQCRLTQQGCATSADCCSGLICGADNTCTPDCKAEHASCMADSECCGNILPDGGTNVLIACTPATHTCEKVIP